MGNSQLASVGMEGDEGRREGGEKWTYLKHVGPDGKHDIDPAFGSCDGICVFLGAFGPAFVVREGL